MSELKIDLNELDADQASKIIEILKGKQSSNHFMDFLLTTIPIIAQNMKKSSVGEEIIFSPPKSEEAKENTELKN